MNECVIVIVLLKGEENKSIEDRASESSSDLRERLYMLVGGWCTRIIPKLWSFFEFLNSSLTRT